MAPRGIDARVSQPLVRTLADGEIVSARVLGVSSVPTPAVAPPDYLYLTSTIPLVVNGSTANAETVPNAQIDPDLFTGVWYVEFTTTVDSSGLVVGQTAFGTDNANRLLALGPNTLRLEVAGANRNFGGLSWTAGQSCVLEVDFPGDFFRFFVDGGLQASDTLSGNDWGAVSGSDVVVGAFDLPPLTGPWPGSVFPPIRGLFA